MREPTVYSLDGIEVVRLESNHLRVDVAPAVGGRIVSVMSKHPGHEFLWRNQRLRLSRVANDAQYDPNFYGGIDELLPNDIPESLHGLACPDHGELWRTPLDWRFEDGALCLQGELPIFGMRYQRRMSLSQDAPMFESAYRLTNETSAPRTFLWKLHAALAIEPGDEVCCPARCGQVVDLAWSRQKSLRPFAWPNCDGRPCNVVAAKDGTVDFFYLFGLAEGRMAWRRPKAGLVFEYRFDPNVFPYAWLFASYGGFDWHYTVVLEPCTAMPMSVERAASLGQCSRLDAGHSLETRVQVFAGLESAA